MESIHGKVADDLKHFGGHLECLRCGKIKPLGDISDKLKNGWPKCCGYTMRWITNKLQKTDND